MKVHERLPQTKMVKKERLPERIRRRQERVLRASVAKAPIVVHGKLGRQRQNVIRSLHALGKEYHAESGPWRFTSCVLPALKDHLLVGLVSNEFITNAGDRVGINRLRAVVDFEQNVERPIA